MIYDKVEKQKTVATAYLKAQQEIAKIYANSSCISEYKAKLAANGLTTGWPIDPYTIYFWFCNRTCSRGWLKFLVHSSIIVTCILLSAALIFVLKHWLILDLVVAAVGFIACIIAEGYFEAALDFSHEHLRDIGCHSEKCKGD